MKIRLFFLTSAMLVISLLLAACNSAASATSTTSSNELSQATELAMGTLKLEGTDQAPTTEQASALLTLWKAYQALSTNDSTAQAELDGLVDQIQENMTAEQAQAIADMQLNSQSQAEIMQSLGTVVISQALQSASQATSAGQPDPGMAPGGDGSSMPMDSAAMPAGDVAMPQASSQASASASTKLQQVSPLLVSAVIEALDAQIQAVSS